MVSLLSLEKIIFLPFSKAGVFGWHCDSAFTNLMKEWSVSFEAPTNSGLDAF